MDKNRRPSKVTIEDGSRSGTAQAVLSDFFDGGQFQALKEQNAHKFRKYGALLSSSADMPNSKTNRKQPIAKAVIPPPNTVPLRSALKTPKTPGLGVGGAVHLGPLHTDDVHRVSDMLHRVTLQPGPHYAHWGSCTDHVLQVAYQDVFAARKHRMTHLPRLPSWGNCS